MPWPTTAALFALAAKMVGIEGEPEVIYPEKKRFSLIDLLLGESILRFLETRGETFPRLYFLFSLSRG